MSIIKNVIRCNCCGDIIESKHTHDFKRCSCKQCAVDGGKQYLKRCYTNVNDYTEMSEYEEG